MHDYQKGEGMNNVKKGDTVRVDHGHTLPATPEKGEVRIAILLCTENGVPYVLNEAASVWVNLGNLHG